MANFGEPIECDEGTHEMFSYDNGNTWVCYHCEKTLEELRN